MPDLPVLSLISKGYPDYPRFILANQQRQVWTGDNWSHVENDGLLFESERDAGRVAWEILIDATKDKRSYRFIAPIEVEIRADQPPDLMQVMLWLMRASRLYLDYRKPGLSDATGLLSIDWTELKEVDE